MLRVRDPARGPGDLRRIVSSAVVFGLFALACDAPTADAPPPPEPVDCATTWDKTCPALEEWEPVSCDDAPALQDRGQREARFHFEVIASGDCGVDCGRHVFVSIAGHEVQPYIRKAVRSRSDCRRCEIRDLRDYVARDVEVDLIAAIAGGPRGWSYQNAMVHPRRPFYPHSTLTLEAAWMELIREPGASPRLATLVRRCPDGRFDPACERLITGDSAQAVYARAAGRAFDEADARLDQERD